MNVESRQKVIELLAQDLTSEQLASTLLRLPYQTVADLVVILGQWLEPQVPPGGDELS